MAGRISMAEYDHLRERFLPPLPAYQGPTVDVTETFIETPIENQAQGSITRTSPTHPDPRLARDYDRLFQLPEDSTPGAGGSGTERSTTPPIETSTSSDIERPSTPTIVPEASSSSSSSDIESRPASPAGSTDSSETVTNLSYTDAKGKQKVMIPRND